MKFEKTHYMIYWRKTNANYGKINLMSQSSKGWSSRDVAALLLLLVHSNRRGRGRDIRQRSIIFSPYCQPLDWTWYPSCIQILCFVKLLDKIRSICETPPCWRRRRRDCGSRQWQQERLTTRNWLVREYAIRTIWYYITQKITIVIITCSLKVLIIWHNTIDKSI